MHNAKSGDSSLKWIRMLELDINNMLKKYLLIYYNNNNEALFN